MNLSRYFPPGVIQAAWDFGPRITHDGESVKYPSYLRFPGATGQQYMASRCLYLFLSGGPVVVQPPLDLCRPLESTDLHIELTEYKQPWEIFGVTWPPEIGGGLTLVWRPQPERVLFFTFHHGKTKVYHSHFQGPADLEGHIEGTPLEDMDAEEEAISRRHARLGLNLGLLLTHKAHRLLRLPAHVVANRKHRDTATRRQAHAEAQVATFRDLDMFAAWQDRRPEPAAHQGGVRAPHLRRGHWKRAACGPRHSQHRLTWVEPFWTGRPEDRQPVVSLVH